MSSETIAHHSDLVLPQDVSELLAAPHLVDVVSEGDLVWAAHVVVPVVQRVQRRLERLQVAVPQVVRVRQAPLAPAVRVAPVVALPGAVAAGNWVRLCIGCTTSRLHWFALWCSQQHQRTLVTYWVACSTA